jgi:formylglycine-generating enzyme required for sulfatase activity
MSQAELVSILTAPGVALEQRIDAAHRLASLGDPRVLPTDRIRIPAGELASGDARRAVRLGAYGIDRFPVTVGAFARFIDAGGYEKDDLWSEPGWTWRTSLEVTRPRFWGEDEWAAYLVSNHPVVGVSFWEAEAYAAFAGGRLPSEHEWEKAARGADGRKYPWGEEWEDDACGMRGVGPRSTVPVGVFPKGVSPFGVWDMVGCVWQWCADPFRGWAASDEEPSDDDDSAAASRFTTCGGAWNTLKWSVTCSSRNGFPPGARFSNLGFRCAADLGEDRQR